MDGQVRDTSGLDQEEVQYYKTVRVLMAQTLYADSWLDL
jgi:hypothetical protein